MERYQDGRLAVEVQLSIGGAIFSGTLVPTVAAAGAPAPALPSAQLGLAAGGGDGASGVLQPAADPGPARGALPAVSGVSMGSGRDLGDTPRALSLAATGATVGGGGPGPSNLGPGAGLAGPSNLEGDSRSEADKVAERRAQAEARIQRMEAAGAPAGTKCALCHGTDTGEQRGLVATCECCCRAGAFCAALCCATPHWQGLATVFDAGCMLSKHTGCTTLPPAPGSTLEQTTFRRRLVAWAGAARAAWAG